MYWNKGSYFWKVYVVSQYLHIFKPNMVGHSHDHLLFVLFVLLFYLFIHTYSSRKMPFQVRNTFGHFHIYSHYKILKSHTRTSLQCSNGGNIVSKMVYKWSTTTYMLKSGCPCKFAPRADHNILNEDKQSKRDWTSLTFISRTLLFKENKKARFRFSRGKRDPDFSNNVPWIDMFDINQKP